MRELLKKQAAFAGNVVESVADMDSNLAPASGAAGHRHWPGGTMADTDGPALQPSDVVMPDTTAGLPPEPTTAATAAAPTTDGEPRKTFYRRRKRTGADTAPTHVFQTFSS